MSTSNPVSFFALETTQNTLKDFALNLRSHLDSSEPNAITNYLSRIIGLMTLSAHEFDNHCTVNIEQIGNRFLREIREFLTLNDEGKSKLLPMLFGLAFRFLCEKEFTDPSEPDFDIQEIIGYASENLHKFSTESRQQVVYAMHLMPIRIAKKILNNPSISDFRNFQLTVENAKNLKATWDDELDKRREHVEALNASLKSATSTYNFVGLVDGFRHLASAKIMEQRIAFWSLMVLAVVMVLPPSAQIYYVLTHVEIIGSKKELPFFTLPAILAIEVLLVYFFRVILAQFRSVKAQVLQLDLRIALCQFVESYAEYSVKINKNAPNTLAKFESVVFSSLVAENEKIPSTFDGAEQLTNLIKSVRGGT